MNDYLREITGEDITAKDFRTWAATHLAAQALREFENFDSDASARRRSSTPSRRWHASRQHAGDLPPQLYPPGVLDGYMDGTLLQSLADQAGAYLEENIHGMTPEEAAVTAFLRLRLASWRKRAGPPDPFEAAPLIVCRRFVLRRLCLAPRVPDRRSSPATGSRAADQP